MKYPVTHWLLAAAVIAAGFVLFQWSWNTLATLFGLPAADGKHALAALILLGLFRFTPRRRGRHEHRGAQGNETLSH